MANPSLIITATDQASPAIDRVRGSLDELLRSFGGFSGIAVKASMLGVSAAIAGIGVAVSNALNVTRWIDDLADSSSALGISVENLAKYQILAKQAGIEAEGLGFAFATLAKNVEAAKAGEDKQVELFRRLGISVKELKQLTPDETIVRVAKAFNELAAGTAKSTLNWEAYGRSGARIEALNQKLASGQEVNTGLTKESIQQSKIITRELELAEIAWKKYAVTLAGPVNDAIILVTRALGLMEKTPEEQIGRIQSEIKRWEEVLAGLRFLEGKRGAPANVLLNKKAVDEAEARLASLREELEKLGQAMERGSARDAPGAREPPPAIDASAVEAARKRAEAARKAQLEADRQAREDLRKAEDNRFEDQVGFREKELAAAKAHTEKLAQLYAKVYEDERQAIEKGAEIIAARRNEQIKEVEDRIDNLTQITESFFLRLQDFEGQDIFKALAKDIAQLAYRLIILEPLLERIRTMLKDMAKGVEFGGKGEGFLGIVMKVLGLTGTGSVNTGVNPVAYGAFDSQLGGPLIGPTLVGEAGPEIVIPHHRTGSAAMGNVSIVQNNSIDSRSDLGTISAMLEMNKQSTLRAVREQLARRSPNLRV